MKSSQVFQKKKHFCQIFLVNHIKEVLEPNFQRLFVTFIALMIILNQVKKKKDTVHIKQNKISKEKKKVII